MISVPNGTGDIADAMMSASQMIYASRMKERILYHICFANISYCTPYIISRKRYIIFCKSSNLYAKYLFYIYVSFLFFLKYFIAYITIIVPINGNNPVTSIPALRPICSVVRLSFMLKSAAI